MRTTIALTAALTAALAVVAGTNGAQSVKHYKTKIILMNGGPTGADGKVSCRTRCPRACPAMRKVRLFRTENGMNQQFGSARTNARGNFHVTAPLLAGDYFAKVDARRLPGNVVCDAAISIKYRF